MFNWLKNLFGGKKEVVPTPSPALKKAAVEAIKTAETAQIKTVTKSKKTTKKKSADADLESMSKKDLLAHAKKNGIKANASMNKGDILAAIKNG